MTKYKFYWDKDTISYFRNMLSFSIVDTKLNVKYHINKRVNKLIRQFVIDDCELQENETHEMLIQDLTNQVYNV